MMVTSMDELQQGLKNMGHVLDTLTKFGMTVNLNKSAVLLDLRGKQKRMVQKQYLRRRLHQQTLQIPGSTQMYDIPLKTSHDYLGVKISYQQTQTNPDDEASFGRMQSQISATATLVQEGESHQYGTKM